MKYEFIVDKVQGWKDAVDSILLRSDISTKNKQLIIQMAKNGDLRPNQRTHPLGKALSNYTIKNCKCYDPEFHKLLLALRPDWFIGSSDKKKKQLLEMAKNGEPKPNWKHPLIRVFYQYIDKNSGTYDAEFHKQILVLRPDWFVSYQKKVA